MLHGSWSLKARDRVSYVSIVVDEAKCLHLQPHVWPVLLAWPFHHRYSGHAGSCYLYLGRKQTRSSLKRRWNYRNLSLCILPFSHRRHQLRYPIQNSQRPSPHQAW